MRLKPPGGDGGEVCGSEMEQQLDGAKMGGKGAENEVKREDVEGRSAQEDIMSKCPYAIGARCHSKLPLSDKEMLSVLAEGKRSLWSVGLW